MSADTEVETEVNEGYHCCLGRSRFQALMVPVFRP